MSRRIGSSSWWDPVRALLLAGAVLVGCAILADAEILGPPQEGRYRYQKTLADNTPTNFLSVTVPASETCNLLLGYSARAADAVNTQTHTGLIEFAAVATAAGAITANVTEGLEMIVNSTGSYTDVFSITAGGSVATLQASFNSSLDVPTRFRWNILYTNGCALAFP